MKIGKVEALEIFGSRGNPAVEVNITPEYGTARAKALSKTPLYQYLGGSNAY